MASTFHQAQRRGFVRGGGAVYTCRCCKRSTRPTGTGDNDGVGLCVECYDLAGEENHLSDTGGEFYDSPEIVLQNIKSIADKGGNASYWDHLKVEAEKQIAARV